MPLNDDDGGIGGGGRISNSRSVDSHLDRLGLDRECIYCTCSLVVFVVLIVNIYCACHLVVYKPLVLIICVYLLHVILLSLASS